MTKLFSRLPTAAGLGGLSLLVSSGVLATDRLGPINITATREAPSIAPSMPETVITRDEIERSQATSLQELLAGQAGLVVSNQGGDGKVSNVSIWGQNARATAVFLDGIRLGSVSLGQTYLEHIPLTQIERIEVLRGPRSGQWGADAGGGVIQLFSRRGTTDGTRVSGGVGAGSRGQRALDATVAGRNGAWDYSVGVAHRESDGFDAQSAESTSDDADGYVNDSVNLNTGYRFGDGGHLRGHFLATSAETEFDGAFQDRSEVERRSFGLSTASGRLGFWQLRARAGRHIDDQDIYKEELLVFRFDTQRDTLFIANDFYLGESTTVTLGADQTYDKLSSSVDYEEDSRRNQALFGQLNSRWGNLDLQLALRRDFNEQFGTANTGSLDLAYALTDTWTLTAGHGTAFNVPSFGLLYYPGYSNPDLQPERTRTTRIGAEWSEGLWTIATTAFRSKARDFIAPGDNPENIDRGVIRGAEIEAGLSEEAWRTSIALTYLPTENETTGERMPKQPRWSGRLNLDRQLGVFSLGASLRGRSGSYGGAYSDDNHGYLAADLRGTYRINADWRLEARVENLFDRDYQVVDGYNQAPRGLFVGLRYGR